MKKSYIAAVGIGLMLALVLTVLPSIAGAEQNEIAKANAEIQKISGQCVSALHRAENASQMDSIAQRCDVAVFQVLADLEATLGHSVEDADSQTCVTNNKVGYTACFDPIHIGGSGG